MEIFDVRKLRKAVHELFPVETLAKGSAYKAQHRVLECTMVKGDGWLVSARVRGSRARPYAVDVEILPEGDELDIFGTCACPQATDCKHVAAVLLQLLDWPVSAFGGAKPAVGGGGQLALLPEDVGSGSPVVAAVPELNPQWQAWLRRVDGEVVRGTEAEAGEDEEGPDWLVFYLRPQTGRLAVELGVVRRLKKGGYGKSRSASLSDVVFRDPAPAYVRAGDRDLMRRLVLCQRSFSVYEPVIEGVAGTEVLRELLGTGRCFLGKSLQRPLVLGPARPGHPTWVTDGKGLQSPGFEVTPAVKELLPLAPPWYVDPETGECGPLETGMAPVVALQWMSAPAVSPAQAGLVAAEIARRAPVVPLPAPKEYAVEELVQCEVTPCLVLHSVGMKVSRFGSYRWGWEPEELEEVSLARVEFDYAGLRVAASSRETRLEDFANGGWGGVGRRGTGERRQEGVWGQVGLMRAEYGRGDLNWSGRAGERTLKKGEDWFAFVQAKVPWLRTRGWRVEIDGTFKHRIAEPEEWYGDAKGEKREGWFGVELGVILDGEKVNLLPLLVEMLRKNPQAMSAEELAKLPEDGAIAVPLPDGRNVLFPAARARRMLGVLLELMNPEALGRDGRLRLPRLRAAEIAGEVGWRWLGATELAEISRRLRDFAGIQRVGAPAGLRATLRPYQEEGISWLQFLREYGLAGILADDMGLGKTVQALAHLVIEKESGRMDRPSLVVAPTSLMTNWRREAERFAPGLRVLVLHGLERKQHFETIKGHDLVVTSYPLLPRDQEVLLKEEFHCVILDEAQFIKNPKTLYAQVACQLKARHHLCLTGTPMENHLGELWSLFHFLLPGFLGDEIRFNGLFRRPIEKGRDDERRVVLAKRVGPFILRRRKEQVMKELPPKTEIVQNVELSGAQRDLYESVRLAMHERVRAEVESKGLSRAHIIILDALLKLRQICCHPRLLSLPSAQKVTESAKLDLLLEQLPEMLEEGRKVLLFSQFTSMLAIIEVELKKREIPYVILTGQTQDRATPVERFQRGDVPLFLISLKAGGTGLNLTAADTVIHYDPWWNPAVENQATDRAHRIGQEKNVFVYKLMTVGTVEEKIAAMQARKRELVEGLLDEERRENVKLTAEDLEVLFAPLV